MVILELSSLAENLLNSMQVYKDGIVEIISLPPSLPLSIVISH